MSAETLPQATITTIYNRLGSRLAYMQFFEAKAKAAARELLALQPDHTVLHVGVGTGDEHALLHAQLSHHGQLVGVDRAWTMLQLTRQQGASQLCLSDVAALPFHPHCFDRVFAAYLFDLLPVRAIETALEQIQQVLRPDGRLVLVSLTNGYTTSSRAFVALWQALYQVRPHVLGGCRPVQLAQLLDRAKWHVAHRGVHVQHGFPSEIVVAYPPRTHTPTA